MEKLNVLTNEGKARRLEDLAKPFQRRAEAYRVHADACEKAGYDQQTKIERDIADLAASDATLLRECAGMMRERGKLQWVRVAGSATRQMALYRGWLLEVGEGDQEWNWLAESGKGGDGDEASTLQAARSAAVAWVDEQEGKP